MYTHLRRTRGPKCWAHHGGHRWRRALSRGVQYFCPSTAQTSHDYIHCVVYMFAIYGSSVNTGPTILKRDPGMRWPTWDGSHSREVPVFSRVRRLLSRYDDFRHAERRSVRLVNVYQLFGWNFSKQNIFIDNLISHIFKKIWDINPSMKALQKVEPVYYWTKALSHASWIALKIEGLPSWELENRCIINNCRSGVCHMILDSRIIILYYIYVYENRSTVQTVRQ